MKKLLLSLGTIIMTTLPITTVVACGSSVKNDEEKPTDPDAGSDGDSDSDNDSGTGGDSGSDDDSDNDSGTGGDSGSGDDSDNDSGTGEDSGSGDDSGTGGDSGNDGSTPDTDTSIRPVMNETEIEQFLMDRSFVIMSSDRSHSGVGMGSGWLMDESEDNWYIGTNRHVTEALDNGDGTVIISNDWNEMWGNYNIRDYRYEFDINNNYGYVKHVDSDSVVNPADSVELWDLFTDLRTTGNIGEIVYESINPNEGNTGASAIDYFDFAVVKVPKLNSTIKDDIEPIEVAPYDYVSAQYKKYERFWFKGYSFASGNYRFGSFFNNTYVNNYNTYQAKAWSPSIWFDPPGDSVKSNWGFDNGPGSSGSAMVDERGYFIANNTMGYDSPAMPHYPNDAKNSLKFHHSGVSGQGFIDTILPLYQAALGEKTTLHPNFN